MPAPETIRAKLAKIARLAESGVDGERANAAELLRVLCEHHRIDPNELLSDAKTWHSFPYRTTFERKLLIQVAVYITDTYKVTNASGNRCLFFEITKAEAIDIKSCFDHYKRELERHLEESFAAFVNATRLFPSKDDSDDDAPPLPRSPEEMARLKRIAHMALLSSSRPWRKSIETSQPH